MDQKIKWAATLSNVREVSLMGSADLGYWEDRLKKEGLSPREKEGRAQIMVLGASAKFMGLRFAEISVSVMTRGADENEAYLVGAFNSRRFFAFCERVIFKTPYRHAEVEVDCAVGLLSVGRRREIGLDARMAAQRGGRMASYEGQDRWEGKVFLPNGTGSSKNDRFFFARLVGRTERYPYVQGEDSMSMKGLESADALGALVESDFVPQEWVIRSDATHAKSKTYLRSEGMVMALANH
jgi:hypothetical protein